jgi:hypothetical protein
VPVDLILSALEDARVLTVRPTGEALLRETSTAVRTVVLTVDREPVADVERMGAATLWRVVEVVPRVPKLVAGCFAAAVADRVVMLPRIAIG